MHFDIGSKNAVTIFVHCCPPWGSNTSCQWHFIIVLALGGRPGGHLCQRFEHISTHLTAPEVSSTGAYFRESWWWIRHLIIKHFSKPSQILSPCWKQINKQTNLEDPQIQHSKLNKTTKNLPQKKSPRWFRVSVLTQVSIFKRLSLKANRFSSGQFFPYSAILNTGFLSGRNKPIAQRLWEEQLIFFIL